MSSARWAVPAAHLYFAFFALGIAATSSRVFRKPLSYSLRLCSGPAERLGRCLRCSAPCADYSPRREQRLARVDGQQGARDIWLPWAALVVIEACPADCGRVDDSRHGDKVVQQHPIEEDLRHTSMGSRIACTACIGRVTVKER